MQINKVLHSQIFFLTFLPSASEVKNRKENSLELGQGQTDEQLRECIRSGDWSSCPAAYRYMRYELAVLGKLVLRGTRIVVPQKLREQILEGHQGVVKTKQRLRSKVWWPGVDRAIEGKYVRCVMDACQLVAQPPPPVPWCDLVGDLLGPLPSGEYLLVVVDYYSRYFEVAILKSVTRRIIDACSRLMGYQSQ